MNVIKRVIPLLLFIAVIVLLWRGLYLHPTEVPSPLINKAAPKIQLPDLLNQEKIITNQDFLGHVTLLNVWATWCEACAEEHEALLQLAQQKNLIIFGFDYKDDSAAAKTWLKEHGNPYQYVAVDPEGTAALDWGVYGTPETFVLDKKGVIRYKQIGPITYDTWQRHLEPLIKKLEQEA